MHKLLEDNAELEEFLKRHDQEGAKWVLELSLYLTKIDSEMDSGVPPREVVMAVVQDFLSNLERVYGSIEGKVEKLLPHFVTSRLEHHADEIMGKGLESTMEYVTGRIDSRLGNSSRYST